METYEYIIIASIILLTSAYYRVREQLNSISKIGLSSKDLLSISKNNLEIALQPKWFLNSIFIIFMIWIFATYLLFKYHGWWSIAYSIGLYISSGILSAIIRVPTKKQILKMFNKTVSKRLNSPQKLTAEERMIVSTAYTILLEYEK